MRSGARLALAALVLLVAHLLFPCARVSAQDLEPRLYSNVPVGMNFLVGAFAHLQGDVLTDAASPLQDGRVRLDGAVLAYARSFALAGKSARLDAVVPLACATGTARLGEIRARRDVCGAADPRLRLALNFRGAPALALKDFAGYRQRTVVGASLQVGFPIGDYDPDKLLNLGNHRFAIKPEVGVSRAIGPVILESDLSAAFFTRNDDFFGGQVKEQDPVFALQGHVVYNFKTGVWAALDATAYGGGRTTLAGVKMSDLQRSARLGASLSLPVNRRQSLKLHSSSGAYARTGSDFDTFTAAWQYRWGGGV